MLVNNVICQDAVEHVPGPTLFVGTRKKHSYYQSQFCPSPDPNPPLMLNGTSWLKRMLFHSPDPKPKIRRHRLVESAVAGPSNNFNPEMSNHDPGEPTSYREASYRV